eukprot:gene22707-59003_t
MGYYLFIEASSPRSHGDTAILEALAQNADALSLWYHMYGSAIGELRVEASNAGAQGLQSADPHVDELKVWNRRLLPCRWGDE